MRTYWLIIAHKNFKTVPGKVATTRAEDGHKQNTKPSVTV